MNGKPFLDTNVLVYAFSQDIERKQIATSLLAQGCLIGVQCLNEFAAVALRKLRMDWITIRAALQDLRDLCPEPIPVTLDVHDRALVIAEQYGYSIYDSLIIAAALEAGMRRFVFPGHAP